MEFLEEETRPKFLFQSRFSSNPQPEPEPPKIDKPITFLCISTSLLLSLLSIFFLQSETLISLILWFSLSLLIGPFAPSSITGGDIRVGQGSPLPPPDLDPSPQIEEPKKRRQKPRKSDDLLPPIPSPSPSPSPTPNPKKPSEQNMDTKTEETEWTDEDFELLKKQISRHPVGEPKRWELITEAFKGRHGMESVIKTAKSFSEKKFENGDSFSQFLKQRKPLDKRIEAKNDGEELLEGEKKQSEWSSGEDIALLNALKVFNKDVAMRWEKIAAAVPGKSKAGCMKRVAELKKDFRSSKASAE